MFSKLQYGEHISYTGYLLNLILASNIANAEVGLRGSSHPLLPLVSRRGYGFASMFED